MQRLMERVVRASRNERGATAVLIVFLIVPMLGFGALAFDLSAQHAEKTQLQHGADAAALAIALSCGEDEAACEGTSQSTGDSFIADNGGTPVEGGAESIEIDFTAKTVEVVAVAEFPHFLASLVDNDEDPFSTTVRSTSTAEWTNGESATVVPFAIGECTVPTTGGSTVKWIPIDNAPCPGAVPGGFGWLDDGTPSCIKDVTLMDFTTITTGNTGKCTLSNEDLTAAATQIGCNLSTVPKSYKSNIEKLFYCFVGRTLLVPVYSLASECPGTPPFGKAYCITKFAAFEIMGVHVKANGSDQVDACKPGYKCTMPKDWGSLGFEGRFISYVTVDDTWVLGPQKPTIKLIG